MRDTSDMMEDALSEDTMMECEGEGGGGGLEDLVDLATDIGDSSSTIRDAAERLLTLLGIDDDQDDMLSSSEDEGVEVDVDETDDEEDEPENTRLLHQLAASLAQELKYSQQKQNTGSIRGARGRSSFQDKEYTMQTMETSQDLNYTRGAQIEQISSPENDHRENFLSENNQEKNTSLPRSKYVFGDFYESTKMPDNSVSSTANSLNKRLRMDDEEEEEELQDEAFGQQQDLVANSWSAGWDACATEALRYLIEEEGLPPYHPTVLAMKNHLDLQRERTLVQYTV